MSQTWPQRRERPTFLDGLYRSAVTLFIGSVIVWLISIPLRDVSIVDNWWPLSFLCASLAAGEVSSTRQTLFLACLSIWSIRLAAFLTYRKWKEGFVEDSRYNDYVLVFKRGQHPNWLVVAFSLINPFWQHLLMQLLIGTPGILLLCKDSGQAPQPPDAAALALWLIGFAFEAGSDLQLIRFRLQLPNRGKALDTCFFAHTRHPNYFSDLPQHVAFWLWAVVDDEMGIRLVGAPFLMFILLRYVSGVELLDMELANRKPQYRAYVQNVSPFVPWLTHGRVDAS
jgi:steroid 5-alpha reductase family enzyme